MLRQMQKVKKKQNETKNKKIKTQPSVWDYDGW